MRTIAPSMGLFFVGSLFLSPMAWAQLEDDKNHTPPSAASPEPYVSPEQKPHDANAAKPTPETQAEHADKTREAAIPLATTKPVQEQTLVSSKALIGVDVKNLQGEKLGDLQELMIDPQTGRVVYATLASGTVLGMGGKPLDIPWEALKVDLGKDGLMVAVDTEKLQAGSSYNMSQR